MNDFTKDFAQALFNPDKINDLLRKELQQAVNNLLEAELTAFLGYDPYARNGWNTGNSRNGAYFRKVDTQFGPIEVQVPRDRNGQFHQHTLPGYKQHSDILESMIIKLYSKGVTTREIADLIEKMYGSHYSPAQVSNISKQMIPKVEAYHQRKLSDKFFCVYLDATYVPLRQETFEREAVYIAIGIKPNGHKEVIDYCIAPSENIGVWIEMLQNMKSRGLKEIEPDLLVFYNYPKQIRASIYSTNMIESFNNVIKRKTKPKAEFPTEQSLDAFIGIQAMSYNERYFNRIHKGFGQVQDTLESYFD
ncbi:IS256 family transposase [Lactobacillus crispatus]|uniref:IS256 family transposase n=4 Tax=Lactobacillus crispatus TaxID=47770 RepID=UPI0018E32937|nr:transposase [Lactobacillus crispatus]MBI1717985.1 transposase [Lactobacillus crispatus]